MSLLKKNKHLTILRLQFFGTSNYSIINTSALNEIETTSNSFKCSSYKGKLAINKTVGH